MRGASMRQVVIALVSCTILCSGKPLAKPVRAAYPSANVQFLPAFVSLEKDFYKREGAGRGAYFGALGRYCRSGPRRQPDPFYFLRWSADAGDLGGNRYHPSRSASGPADFLSGRAARDLESLRSQRKKVGGELWRLYLGRHEGAVGT